jgi:hypothetical protein
MAARCGAVRLGKAFCKSVSRVCVGRFDFKKSVIGSGGRIEFMNANQDFVRNRTEIVGGFGIPSGRMAVLFKLPWNFSYEFVAMCRFRSMRDLCVCPADIYNYEIVITKYISLFVNFGMDTMVDRGLKFMLRRGYDAVDRSKT